MNSTKPRRSPQEIFAEVRRTGQVRRSAGQLSFQGFESQRRGARTTPPEQPNPAGSRRRIQRSRPKQAERTAPGTLTPVEQMTILRSHEHLLSPKEREWVAKIGRTVSDRGGAYLSERQQAVIADIFDRFRARIGC